MTAQSQLVNKVSPAGESIKAPTKLALDQFLVIPINFSDFIPFFALFFQYAICCFLFFLISVYIVVVIIFFFKFICLFAEKILEKKKSRESKGSILENKSSDHIFIHFIFNRYSVFISSQFSIFLDEKITSSKLFINISCKSKLGNA